MAGKDRAAAWIDGRVADSWPQPGGPGRLLAALLVLLVLVDVTLALALRERQPEILSSATDARAVVAEASADPDAWLMIGDSVLAGDVMAGRVADWQQHRVIDYLAVEQAPAARDAKAKGRVRFRQVALDGLLPVDIDRIVAELDRHDPAGAVPVVVELNMRYFSRHYADEVQCTRPWICALGGLDLARDELTTVALAPLTRLAAGLRPWVPILRHKRRLDLDHAIETAGLGLAVAARKAKKERLLAEGQVRVAEHYRESALGGDSAQIQALDRVLERLRARGRRAVFFTTPLRDSFVAEVASEEELGGRYAALAERIHDSGARASLVALDHPLFVPELFLDHCHLGAAGNRLLAQNLLHALDIGLARMPSAREIIRNEGPHETLVGRVDTGYAEGSSWQALFDHPDGLAVRAEPREVIVADTGNHVLRRLRHDLETTELLAGRPGEAGRNDGFATAARLDGPRQPCFLGDAVYFIDGSERRLRVLVDSMVRWVGPTVPGLLKAIRCHGEQVWLLAGDSLYEHRPGTGQVRRNVLVSETGRVRATTFTLARDGRIFVADAKNRIFVGEALGGRVRLSEVFANAGKEPLPRERNNKFPYDFNKVHFDAIHDLVYVERYGGLLVQDVLAPQQPVPGLTENAHLRYLNLDDRKVYPWIKPEVNGQSYVMYNASSDSLVSGFHQGSMALDQGSASLFYIEQARSRLVRIEDGILGAAKIGHFGGNAAKLPLPDRLGGKLGPVMQAKMAPHRHLAARWERRPRQGPYLGLLVGSSTSAYHDILGEYSLGRRIERELGAELGYRDRVGFELYHRASGAASLAKMVQTIHESEEQGLPFDVAFLEIYGLTDRFVGESKTEAEQLALLGELEAIRRKTKMLIVFLDTTSLGSRRRDAMRAPPREAVLFMALAERLGFPVLRPSDRLMREHLDHSAWSNQPWGRKKFQHHGSTWGIDLTGATLASMAYPLVAAHFEGNQPRHLRGGGKPGSRAKRGSPPKGLLVDALVKVERASLPVIDREVIQVRYQGGHLRLFLDRGRPGAGGEAEAVVLAALYGFLVDDIYGPLVEQATIELARFRSYNEYGLGVLDEAEVEATYTFKRGTLDTFVQEALARHPEWSQAEK